MTNPGSDEQQIRAIVETYARGCAHAAPEVVGSVFADDAHMWGWLGDDYVTAPIGAFLDVVRDSAANPDRAAGYSFEILGVHVHGRQALVAEEFPGGPRGPDDVMEVGGGQRGHPVGPVFQEVHRITGQSERQHRTKQGIFHGPEGARLADRRHGL